MTVDETKCREAFESWCYEKYNTSRSPNGFYIRPATDIAWKAYQAAWSHTPEPTEAEVEAAARASHDAYERAAKQFGWDTKPECRVEFDDLPDANKKTMLAAMEAALRAAFEVKGSGA